VDVESNIVLPRTTTIDSSNIIDLPTFVDAPAELRLALGSIGIAPQCPHLAMTQITISTVVRARRGRI
jgi:hypothetical protein